MDETAALKHMLITIVEQELKVFFENKVWHWAARGALATGDRMLEEILLLKIMEEKELSGGQYEAPGRLAIAIGNIALAEQIIRDLEKTIGEPYSDRALVSVVCDLGYMSTPKRIMRIFEDREDFGQVLNIASAIGDRETCVRLIKKMSDEGRLFDNTKPERLEKAVSYNPVLGKALLKNLENPREKKEWYMECAGLVAAALGETRVAKRAFEYLEVRGRFDQLQAGRIAAKLGYISDAEEMVVTVYTSDAMTRLVEGDRLYSDSLGDIIGSVVMQNVEGAERIWRHLTKVVFGNLLPMVAVRVLEVI